MWHLPIIDVVACESFILDARGIHIRYGVIYELFVPYEAIQGLQRGRLYCADTKRKNYLNCAFINAPDCILKLRGARPASRI